MNSYMQFPSIVLAVGYCASGKSTALKYTIQTIETFDFYIIISNTAQFNNDWDFIKSFERPFRIYNGSKINEIIHMVLAIQEKNLKAGKVSSVALVLDDILGSLNNSDIFKKLVSCYRHFKISVFMTTQFCNGSTTMVRELSSYIFCFDQRSEQSKKAIFQSYFNDVPTFNDFKKIFSGLKPFQFFFIDRVKKRRFKMLVPYGDEQKKNDTDDKAIFEIYKNI